MKQRAILEHWGDTISAANERAGLPPVSRGIELLDGRTAFDAAMPDSEFAREIARGLGVPHVQVVLRVEVPPVERKADGHVFMYVGGVPCTWAKR